MATEEKIPEAQERQSLMGHLSELFVRVQYIIYSVIVGMLVAYSFSARLVELMTRPMTPLLPEGTKIVFITPFEKIWVHLRVSFIAGFALVLPLVLWHVAAFVGPALHEHERRKVRWAIFSTTAVFILGVYLGYQYTLPTVMKALMNYGGSDTTTAFLSLSPYINTALGILLATAVLLELPVVQVHLSSWGWVSADAWSKNRKGALVGNALVSAILSPPDAMSMLLMMVPIQLLYECGILGARVAEWTQHGKAPKKNSNPA